MVQLLSGTAVRFCPRIWSTWSTCLAAALFLALSALPGAVHSSLAESTNNWAVLVCTSRYWFNYRHMANTLGMYRTVKRLGIPDSNIILMLADDAACNSRNAYAGKVFGSSHRQLDLYGESIEVDYRGYEVSVENFIRLLTGRTNPDTPVSKRLNTDERSNIFIYMTGHGGDEFLKFQDAEEISAFDVADAFQQMHVQKRYKEIFFMIDTCQANTMYSKFYSPGVLATGSSRKGENSYSDHSDPDIGVAVIDRYTRFVLEYLEGVNKTSETTMQDLFNKYNFDDIHSLPGVRTDLYPRSPSEVRLTEFFGGVAEVSLEENYPGLEPAQDEPSPADRSPDVSSSIPRRRTRRLPPKFEDPLVIRSKRRKVMESFSTKFEYGAILFVVHAPILFLSLYYRSILKD